MSDISDLAGLIEGLNGARVLCIGDVMLDRYVSGSVERISPEAPIPVLRIEKERSMLGGVGNVAANIQALNGGGGFISMVGKDGAGREVEHLLETLSNVQPNLVTIPDRPTTLKTRFVGGAQQLMRADTESTEPLDDAEQQILQTRAAAQMANHGALVLSDYGKGVSV